MKEKTTNIIINSVFIIVLILCFFNKNILIENTILASNLFLYKIFPFLFIIIIIQEILINYNIYYYLTKVLKNNKIIIIFISIISGNPANVLFLQNLYEKKYINKIDFNNYLEYTYFSNPLFLINMLSLIFSKTISIKLFIIHYISNIIISIPHKTNKINIKYQKPKTLTDTIYIGLKKSIDTSLIVFSNIVLSSILIGIITNLIKNNILIVLIKGLGEITQGLNNLINLSINSNIKQIITLIIICFGGISIHMQVYSCLKNNNLKYNNFFKGRIKSIFISIILYILITLINYII